MNRVENMETVQTLIAMKAEIERLQKENDSLREQLLKAPNAKMVGAWSVSRWHRRWWSMSTVGNM